VGQTYLARVFNHTHLNRNKTISGLHAPFLPYFPAVIALTTLIFAIPIQSFLTGVLGLAKSDEVPGMPLKGNHADFSFRVIRTYGNSVETLPLFAATLFLAIATSASPAWVNGLAGLHERCG
jgi:uncharacterized MAPEG superfamily protein